MLRTTFVLLIVVLGLPIALRDAFGGLLLYLWVAYFRPEYWVWNIAFIQSLNLSLITGVYLLVRSVTGDVKFRLDVRSVLLLLFLAISFISTIMSGQDEYAWPWFTDFAKALLVAYLISVLVTDLQKFRMVIMVIAFSLGIEASKQGWVGLILHPGGNNDNRQAMLGDNNGVAVGMLMLTALFIALAKTSKTVWERRLHQVMAFGVGYRALVTYSRGGFLAAAVMTCVYVARSQRKIQSALIAATLAGGLAVAMPASFWERMSTIPTSQTALEGVAEGDEGSDASAASRVHFWRVATNMALANPLLGVGLNAFTRVYNQYDFSKGMYGKNRSVHSLWFGVLAELGLPAFCLFVAMLAMAMFGCGTVIRCYRRGELPQDYFTYAVALQAALTACLIGGTFLPFQYVEILWHFVGLSMALRSVALAEIAARSPVNANPYAAQISTGFRPARAASGT
jgi:putative inorganic carbon (HCO3(-)) transporter